MKTVNEVILNHLEKRRRGDYGYGKHIELSIFEATHKAVQELIKDGVVEYIGSAQRGGRFVILIGFVGDSDGEEHGTGETVLS